MRENPNVIGRIPVIIFYKSFNFLSFFYLIIILYLFQTTALFPQTLDLTREYSRESLQKGIIAFNNTEYEQAITYLLKAIGYWEDNEMARYFLGDSYRKAGYENNAIFEWNNLLALGYKERSLKNKILYLYNKKGILNEININKTFLLRDDIKGFYNDKDNPLFIKPSQVSIDSNNHYYIASFLSGMVVELDPNLTVVKNHFPLLNKIERPFGVVVDRDGYLYISDFKNDVVIKLDQLGNIVKKIGFKGLGEGALLGPEYLLLDNEENLYVVDSGNRRINKYKKNGDILFSFGNQSEGKLMAPAGIFYQDEKIYVCDKEANRIMVYDKSGNFLKSFGEEQLVKPFSLTMDNYGRFLILCEKEIWVYESVNSLWYQLDSLGTRLQHGISIVTDKENNILLTDFNTSRFFVLSHERERYNNLNLNIERIFSAKFPKVMISVTVEKIDFSQPTGIRAENFIVYENGKLCSAVSDYYTEAMNNNTDILIILDANLGMMRYKNDISLILDQWIKSAGENTHVCLVTVKESEGILNNDFNSTRLSILDSINKTTGSKYTDKGSAIKYGINHILKRLSKKAVILLTNGDETGNDFTIFKTENSIALASNNNIPIYVVTFAEGRLSNILEYAAKKTGGEYINAYQGSELKNLFKKIEGIKSKEILLSYNSKSISRFGDEPIAVTIEVNYNGVNGIAKSLYYPQVVKKGLF